MFEAVPESVAELGADGLSHVLETLHDLVRLPAQDTSSARPDRVISAHIDRGDAAAREAELLAFTTRAADHGFDDDPGPAVLRHLTDHARLSLLVDQHRPELRALLREHGRERTDELLRDFLACTPASAWPAEQNAAFAEWYRAR
jgi:hypothetical protein